MNKSIQLNVKSINLYSFRIYNFFLKKVLEKLNIKYHFYFLPLKKKKITLLKSPHVYKTAREQFEIKYYRVCIRIINIKMLTLYWLLLNKPSIVQIKIKQR